MIDPGMDDLLTGLDPDDVAELERASPAFARMRQRQQAQGQARKDLAAAVAGIAATPAGVVLFQYLDRSYNQRHENVTLMGLPMETAIQLHAMKDGQRELVKDLLRLVAEGRKET